MPKSEADIRASLEDVIHDVERNKRIYGWFAGHISITLCNDQPGQQGGSEPAQPACHVAHNASLPSTLATETSNLAHRMEQRFDDVDNRFEAVDRRFDAVDQQFEAVDKRFDAVEERVDSLEMTTKAGFDRVDNRLGLLEDSSRQTLAQLERLSGFIIRDELKAGKLAREEVTDVAR